MTEAQFRAYYDGGRHVDPYGDQVQEFAFALLAHQDAARTIRHEVFKRAYEQCAKFEQETAWGGDPKTDWEGLKEMTRACCLEMILLPYEENPLAKPELVSVPETDLNLWYLLVRELSFEHRQVLFLSLFFRENPRNLGKLLNKSATEARKLQAQVDEELARLILNAQTARLRTFSEELLRSFSS